jgi:hypothetical protein
MSRQLWRLPDDRATLAMIRSTSVEPHIATALDIGPVDAIRSRPCIELYVPPRADEIEYQTWAFVSLWSTAIPWISCSVPIVLIVDSLETRKLSRRLWITTIWAMIVICVAGIYFEPVLRSPAMDIAPVGDLVSEFAFPWLCGLLIALWIALELERTTRDGRTTK